jgi:dihydroorotate dehydrogenase
MRCFWPIADYIALNFTSPRRAIEPHSRLFESFVMDLGSAREELARHTARDVPLVPKISLDSIDGQRANVFSAAGCAAVIGLSGDLRILERAFAPLPIVSVGEIRTAADATSRLARGAPAVQIHRAFADGRPRVAREIAVSVATLLRAVAE